MLIKNKEFDLPEFKKFYKKMNWIKAPRKLGEKYTDYFYIGKYEDDEKIINISIFTPAMEMQVTESFKGFDKNGKKVSKEYKGKTYQFGTTVQVRITESFLDKIKEISKFRPENKKQIISWE